MDIRGVFWAGVFGIFIFGAVCFGAPVIEVVPTELNFVALEGKSNPAGKILYISNGGTGRLEWEINETCAWLGVDPVIGETLPSETDEVTVSIDMTGLSVGEYSCELTVTDPEATNSPQIVEVTLNIEETILEVLRIPKHRMNVLHATKNFNSCTRLWLGFRMNKKRL